MSSFLNPLPLPNICLSNLGAITTYAVSLYDDDDVEVVKYYGRTGLVKLNCDLMHSWISYFMWAHVMGWCAWGLVYASSVDDYKLVRILELPKTHEIMVHTFSLRTNEWRRIGKEMYTHLFSLSIYCDQIL